MGNVFNRYGAGGGKAEGLYLWKKYEYIAEQTIVNPTMRVYKTFSTNIRLEAINFDIRPLPSAEKSNYTYICANDNANSKIVCDFLDGFGDFNISVPEKTLSIIWVKGNNAGSGITKVEHASYDANLVNLSLYTSYSGTYDKTVTYEGTKTLPPAIGDMVGYVVSDKEDAYPDKEVKDGYYYERYSALEPALFGCTKYETGAVSVTSRVPTVTVSHSMGVKPKFAFVWKSRAQGTQNCRAVAITYSDDGIYCAMSNWGNSGSNTNGSVYNTASGVSTLSNVTLVSDASNNYYKFYSGGYSYILLG